jgi:branched-chain amino acid transport system permease protein
MWFHHGKTPKLRWIEKGIRSIDMLEQTIVNGLLLGSTYVMVASGLTLVFGVMRIFNFAHGELFMLGGFAGYFLLEMLGINFFLALVLTMLGLFLFGWLIERYTFRFVRGKLIASMLLSLGVSTILSGGAMLLFTEEDLSVESVFPGVIRFGNTVLATERVVVILLCFLIMVALFLFLNRFKVGRAMRAVSLDPEAAVLQGVNIDFIASLCFGLAAAMAGTAGLMILPLFKVNASIGVNAIINSLVVVVLGGMGSVPGSVVGGLILGFVNSFAITYIGGTIGGIFGFLMIIVMIIIRPKGLMGHE